METATDTGDTIVDSGVVLETGRLTLRRVTAEDFAALSGILGDREVMYAWGYAFSGEQMHDWIEQTLARYDRDGCGHFAATLRGTQTLIGVIGPLIERIGQSERMGVGYILAKQYWGRGYAAEGARACVDYAFHTLGASSVIAEIRPENAASVAVARRLGMEKTGEFVKWHNGVEMLHDIYEIRRGGSAE